MSEKYIPTESLKEIAKEAYQDGGKAVVKPTGELLSLIPRTIKAALLPIEKWVIDREYNLAATQKLLQQKLENIPPEQIVSPEAHIAVPAIQYISYCIDNYELRNMYANLLAKSMSSVIKNNVHPAFIEIIKQLCPDEAKIMKELYKRRSIPTLSVRKEEKPHGGIDIISNFSDIGYTAECEYPLEVIKYFDNLIRLGLLKQAPTFSKLTNDTLYDSLINHSYIQSIASTIKPNEFISIKYPKSYINITYFGKKFCSICLDDNIKSQPSSES